MNALRVLAAILLFIPCAHAEEACSTSPTFAFVIHGGAGDWNLPPAERTRYVAVFQGMLQKAQTDLQNGVHGLDVVEAAIKTMEDSGLFNAGKGSIPNAEGIHELDASIMDGRDLKAGAVAVVKTVKNPIAAARRVMERTRHVLLAAQGADTFARDQGLPLIEPSYFERSRLALGTSIGTVGAAVLDRCGNVAAGTSTGGYPGKMPGRVGDSPIIGAGTYAKNSTGAMSATGHGEFFMRYVATHEASALMEYAGLPLTGALERVIKDVLRPAGGEGGMIGVDAKGNVAVANNMPGMLHGYVTDRENPVVGF